MKIASMTTRSDSALPQLPPKPPSESLAYCKHVAAAPFTALRGVVVDGRQPPKFVVAPRYRVRNQVGLTNRWRLPDSLYSDLLGSSQALKAVQTPLNQTLLSIMTGKGRHTSLPSLKPQSKK